MRILAFSPETTVARISLGRLTQRSQNHTFGLLLFLLARRSWVQDSADRQLVIVNSVPRMGLSVYRIASSKTLFRFLCVSAEHSRYFRARISLETCNACSYETGSILFCLKASIVARSSRRSNLVPTRMIGTFGA